MNYIAEMNAFMNWLDTNPLDATTQALWFHIMAIANKSGWPKDFTIANLTLMAKVNVSENTLNKHRNFLIQKGRIEYKNQGKQKAGKYRLIPFTSNNEVRKGFTSNNEVNHEANHEVKCEVNPSALYKLNKTKLNKTKTIISSSEDISLIANEFEQNGFGAITATVKDLLINLSEQYSTEWIIEAMKIAVKANARNIRYVEGILRRWNNSGGMKLSKDKSEEPESAENIYGW